MIVVDSSYVLACVMPDEPRPQSMRAVLANTLIVPFTWPVEIANALRSAIRRKRLDTQDARLFADQFSRFDARVAAPWHSDTLRYFDVASAHDLTPYDALYVELCLAERGELATCDPQLSRAAARVGIPVHS